MEKEFVPYEIAFAMKELGFDEPCFRMYIKGAVEKDDFTLWQYASYGLKAPLYQQAFRWFREEHKIIHEISEKSALHSPFTEGYSAFIKQEKGKVLFPWEISKERFESYEEAELACLKKLIETVKKDGN